jgi:hypothetical protein
MAAGGMGPGMSTGGLGAPFGMGGGMATTSSGGLGGGLGVGMGVGGGMKAQSQVEKPSSGFDFLGLGSSAGSTAPSTQSSFEFNPNKPVTVEAPKPQGQAYKGFDEK